MNSDLILFPSAWQIENEWCFIKSWIFPAQQNSQLHSALHNIAGLFSNIEIHILKEADQEEFPKDPEK